MLLFLSRITLIPLSEKIFRKSRTVLDDLLIEKRVIHRAAVLIPPLALYFGAPMLDTLRVPVSRFALACVALLFSWILIRILGALHEYLHKLERAGKRSPTVLIHTLQIASGIVGLIVALSTLLGKSPALVLSSLGAIAAILTLAFRETILSLVSGIIIHMNETFREGDWIEMPAYGIDGDLIELGLHTAKIRNWDKTISTIPVIKLLQEPVKNWQGMRETKGRRIKRPLLIDQTSIHFCDAALLERISEIEFLKKHITDKRREIEEYNRGKNTRIRVNGRHLTNLGLFRAYIRNYLANHPRIRPDLTLLVRQLKPDAEQGLPLEIYCFADDVRWANYEDIQSDLFDHLYAVLPEFGLRPFQRSSSSSPRP